MNKNKHVDGRRHFVTSRLCGGILPPPSGDYLLLQRIGIWRFIVDSKLDNWFKKKRTFNNNDTTVAEWPECCIYIIEIYVDLSIQRLCHFNSN